MLDWFNDVLLGQWDTLARARAAIGSCEGVESDLDSLEAFYAAIRDGMLEGKPLEQFQLLIRLVEFSDLANYAQWLHRNIAVVYRMLADQSYTLKRPESRPKPSMSI